MFGFIKKRRLYDDSDDYSDNSSEKYSDESNDDGGANVSNPLRNKLLQVLTNIHTKTSCEFAVGKTSSELTPLPGIKIKGYGPVSLPVTKINVKGLKKHFKQAPYGLGEATLIDKTVRDSWQLDPEKFEITNPQFNTGVEKLVKEVKSALGCSDLNVTSHLYKLLLYEPGGHFKPHRDTEKFPGMFATLIIQVPSIFTGGDLVVKHNTQEKRIVFSADEAAFQCIYAAHYADCEHELTEIKSGYRMALVYSLCWDGNGVVPSPPDIPTNNLADLLKQIDQIVPNPSMLAWGLDHQYSTNSLHQSGVEALKGGDKLIYSSLQGANDLLDDDKKLEFFIVEANRTDNMYGDCTAEYGGRYGNWGHCSGDCFELTGDCEKEYEYKVIGVDGHEWNGSLNFDINVRKDVLNVGEGYGKFWGECHKGECSGPSGNEGASQSNWYQRFVLVMFPKENAVKVEYKNSVDSAIIYLQQQLDKKGVLSVKKLASDIVELCIDKKDKFCRSEKNVVTMLKMLMKMKELELTKKILLMLSEPSLEYYTSSSRYSRNAKPIKGGFGIQSDEMITLMKDLISTFKWKALGEAVTNLVQSCPSKYYKHTITFIEQCPKAVPKEKLFAAVVQKAVSVQDEEDCLTDETVTTIGQVILNHHNSCSQFIKPFLDLPDLQELPMLNNILSFWEKNKNQDLQKDVFYTMTFTKFWEMIQKLVQDVKSFRINSIVKGAEFLITMQEDAKFNKLVDDVLKTSNPQLMKKLLASSFCQSASVAEPVKYLIQARVNQLLPIVQAGKPNFSWCQLTAIVPGHPEVQAFLRGPDQSYVYRKFNARTKADQFQREYSRFLSNIVVSINGVRKDTLVTLTKSPSIKAKHDEAVKKYKEDRDELNRLQAKLVTKSE